MIGTHKYLVPLHEFSSLVPGQLVSPAKDCVGELYIDKVSFSFLPKREQAKAKEGGKSTPPSLKETPIDIREQMILAMFECTKHCHTFILCNVSTLNNLSHQCVSLQVLYLPEEGPLVSKRCKSLMKLCAIIHS